MSDTTHIEGDSVHGDKIAGDKVGGDKITNITVAPSRQQADRDRANARNRKNYLNALQTTWIDGFLHQSLHNEVIKLTMTEAEGDLLARDGRQRSWGMVKRQARQADEPIPFTKPVGDIFEESGRGLLILGDPGSGKTITLLQLAEQLMNATASQDQLMPVVLNLSSWGQMRPPLIEWLVEEIFVQYSVGRSLARRWIEENQFVYLLDGLDEVATDARNDCIEAINAFRADRAGVVEMAVCSRTKDYDQLTTRLNLTVAIQIQPLTDTQVDAYLRQPKLEMQAVQATLKTDPTLRELTRSPLWLNVMTLAYRGKTHVDLGMMDSPDARRDHLFDTYIDAMFVRRPLPANGDYDEADARHWLVEVAYGLAAHQVSELYLEKLQPDWLPNGKPRRQYPISYGLIVGLIIGLISGLSTALLFFVFGLAGGLVSGLSILLSTWLWIGLFYGLSIEPSKDINQIMVIEELQWRTPYLRQFSEAIKEGMAFGLISGLSTGFVLGLILGLDTGLIFGLAIGLSIGVSTGLISGLSAFFNMRETQVKAQPNQGIYSSLHNLLRMSFLHLTVLGGIGIMVSLIFYYATPQLPYLAFIIVGLFTSIGLSAGFWNYGGAAILRHYTLRLVLARQGILPYPLRDKKLIAYLDAMVERLLLRRVGNGYMFIHRTLMEHFAAKHE